MHLYITLSEPVCVGMMWFCGFVGMWVCVSYTIHLHFWDLLRYTHKRISTIAKVYIATNNIHVEIIRFGKISDFIHVCEATGLSDHSMFTAYSLDGSNWPQTN